MSTYARIMSRRNAEEIKELKQTLPGIDNEIEGINNEIEGINNEIEGIDNEIDAFKLAFARPSNPIKLMCLYYGYPNMINGAYNTDRAAQYYAKYDIIVFGDGVEHDTHPDYANALAIIEKIKQRNSRAEIFGYIGIGMGAASQKLDAEVMEEYVDEWKAMGCTGIFLDEFGYDYGVSRARQNRIVKYCHDNGLNTIVNCWNYDWVFSAEDLTVSGFEGNLDELPPEVNENDYYLFENLFANIDTTQKVGSNTRLRDAVNYRQATKSEYGMSYYEKFGTKTLALTGIDVAYEDKEKLFTQAYLGSIILGLDGFGASIEYWGASSANFIHYNPPKLPELLMETKPYTSVGDYGEEPSQIEFAVYEAEFPNASLKLEWVPDEAAPTDPAGGIFKIYWNGEEIEKLSLAVTVPPAETP